MNVESTWWLFSSPRRGEVSEVGWWQGMGLRDKRPASGHEWGERAEIGQVSNAFLRGGFKHFLFLPLPLEMIQIDEHIFQIGWNHQLYFFFAKIMSWCEVTIEDPPQRTPWTLFFPRIACDGCESNIKKLQISDICMQIDLQLHFFLASSVTMHHKTDILTSFNWYLEVFLGGGFKHF